MMRYAKGLGAAVVAGCAIVTASCGGGYVKEEKLPTTGATLEGTVTYGSEKVPVALIVVAGAGASSSGEIDEATGRYKVENVPVGEVKIGVNTQAARGMMQGKLMAGYYKGPEAKSKGIVAPPNVVDVPAKYANAETSGLRTTTTAGANTYDIKIPK